MYLCIINCIPVIQTVASFLSFFSSLIEVLLTYNICKFKCTVCWFDRSEAKEPWGRDMVNRIQALKGGSEQITLKLKCYLQLSDKNKYAFFPFCPGVVVVFFLKFSALCFYSFFLCTWFSYKAEKDGLKGSDVKKLELT